MIVAGIDIPIQLAQVIARDIIPVIGKLNAVPMPRRAPFAAYDAGLDLAGYKLKTPETVEESSIKRYAFQDFRDHRIGIDLFRLAFEVQQYAVTQGSMRNGPHVIEGDIIAAFQ